MKIWTADSEINICNWGTACSEQWWCKQYGKGNCNRNILSAINNWKQIMSVKCYKKANGVPANAITRVDFRSAWFIHALSFCLSEKTGIKIGLRRVIISCDGDCAKETAKLYSPNSALEKSFPMTKISVWTKIKYNMGKPNMPRAYLKEPLNEPYQIRVGV